MAEGTYEYECMRAELLGLEKPDKEKFEQEQAEKLKAELEEISALQGQNLETEDESLNDSGGKLDELHSILSRTHKKLNLFKTSACSSLTNIFKSQSSMDEETGLKKKEDTTEEDKDVNSALTALEKMEIAEKQPNVEFAKHASLDFQNKMTSNLDKLDSLLTKAEHAEMSMSAQNKQMRKYLK